MEIQVSSNFKRRYSKLPLDIKIKAEHKEKFFIASPFHPSLHTHKLHGRDSEFWAYSVDYSYRIKFAFLDDNTVLYLDIGTHDEVY